jgi:uncharacterized membrane protein
MDRANFKAFLVQIITWVFVVTAFIVVVTVKEDIWLLLASIPLFGFITGWLILGIFRDLLKLDVLLKILVSMAISLMAGLVISVGVMLSTGSWSLALSTLCLALIATVLSIMTTYQLVHDISNSSSPNPIVKGINDLKNDYKKFSPFGRVVVVLATVALLVIAGISVALILTDTEERFTEFYVLNDQGKAHTYTQNYTIGQEGQVIFGLNNHEGRTVGYTIEVWLVNYTFTNMQVKVYDMYSISVEKVNLEDQKLNLNDPWYVQYQRSLPLNFTTPGNFSLLFMLYLDNTQNSTYVPSANYATDPVVSWKVVDCVNGRIQYLKLNVQIFS